MPDPVWYRSLYWRIAFGFVAMLAAVLLAQGLVVLWLTDRIVGLVGAVSGSSSSTSVAAELSAALATRSERFRSSPYVADEFSHIYQPFLVVMVDGRTASNRPNGLPPGYVRAVQQRLRRGESTQRSGGWPTRLGRRIGAEDGLARPRPSDRRGSRRAAADEPSSADHRPG